MKPEKPYSPQHYWITIKDHLDKKWSDWFEGLTIAYEGDNSILSGPVSDQAALHGLLIKIRDLNMTLLSVERIESAGEE